MVWGYRASLSSPVCLLLLNLVQDEGLQMETRTTDPADVGTEALLRTDEGHVDKSEDKSEVI